MCVCVNGQGLAGGDFVRLCPLMPMFGCWVYRFLVLCFCFHFMSFNGKKYIVYCAILFIARDLVVIDQFSNISWTLVSLNFMTRLLLSIKNCENSEIKSIRLLDLQKKKGWYISSEFKFIYWGQLTIVPIVAGMSIWFSFLSRLIML